MYRHAEMAASTVPWAHGSTKNAMGGVAYTPVIAQRTLSSNTETPQANSYHPRPPTHTEPPEPEPPRQRKMDFPPELRDYVQRSFAIDVQVPGIEKEEVEAMLKQVINDAAKRDQLHAIQWEVFPLPQEIIKKQRAQSFGITPKTSTVEPHAQHRDSPSVLAANNSNSPPNNKKRKPDDHGPMADEEEKLPPWRRNVQRNALEDRISYPNQDQADRMEKRLRRFQDAPAKSSKNQADQEKRKQRFANVKSASGSPWSSREDSPDESAKGPIVGTCQTLEKKYFRLTSAPKPESVRPLPVLEKTLTHLISKWKMEHNYNFICDQFKSLRQDLTVQHIKTGFTVKVYEIHARIALEQGDLGEYNQCQTQLRALYSQSLGGNPGEFLAYRILYLIHTCNRSDMNDVLADLTEADKADEAVKYALAVRSALALGNYHKFFKLYLDAPGMGAYLMDKFIDRERLAALANICKAYKPDVPLRYITEELGFESDRECAQFLCDQNGQDLLEEKDGVVRFLSGKAGNLFENARAAAFRKVDIKGQI